MQPANPFSLATSISTASINCPKAPAFSPNGGVKVSDDEESDIDSPKVNQLKSRRSLNKGSRQSIRAPVGVKPRSSLMNQRSSVADIPQLPTAHVNYYENLIKKDEVDGHASWISFVLYEETKIIEKLAKLDPNDDELTLALRKRSTMINISTTTNTKKNFTKKERNILEEHVIEFNNKIYEKRRSSSVIQKITSPMPKSLIE